MFKRPVLMIGFALICAALVCGESVARGQSGNLRINGTVVGISGRLAGRSLPFSLIVKRYTSVAEQAELSEALQQGLDQMLRSLTRMDAGRIQIGNNVGVTANAIIAVPWENGTRITVVYERNVNSMNCAAARDPQTIGLVTLNFSLTGTAKDKAHSSRRHEYGSETETPGRSKTSASIRRD